MALNDTRHAPDRHAADRRRPHARLVADKRARARAEEVACQRLVRALNRGLPTGAVTVLARHYAEAHSA